MYQRVKAYIQNQQMLKQNEKVIVGVSGGADSICLLFMLIELKKEWGLSLKAVHVHHGLREEAADADERYVRQVCRQQGIALKVVYEDVKAYAARHKMSLEEAGRKVRRRAFEAAQEEWGPAKIALAHHQNDNAETLLFHLCRGCGLKGISGIAPKNGDYIRPLLCLKREDIESYLENRGISYCTDETNLDDTYTRNRIRNHVIPYLEKEVNSQAVRHMSETMEQMRLIREYMEQEASEYIEKCVQFKGESKGECLLLADRCRGIPEALKPYVFQELLVRMAGHSRDIESTHIKMLCELFEKQVGRRIDLPYGLRAKRCYEGIALKKESGFPKSGEGDIDITAKIRVFEREPGEVIFPQNPYTKWFDYDIIKNTVKIRHRKPGDYITVTREGKTQKLKQFLINQKIPQEVRDHIWLVADGQHIMWIVGYRQNQKYQITKETSRILEVDFCKGERDGRKC